METDNAGAAGGAAIYALVERFELRDERDALRLKRTPSLRGYRILPIRLR
jgi:hypothetical protein